jgi:hypothetical protein
MALPSKSTQASELGEIHRFTQVVASSATSDQSPDLGSVATSHIGGEAGWWKPPSASSNLDFGVVLPGNPKFPNTPQNLRPQFLALRRH